MTREEVSACVLGLKAFLRQPYVAGSPGAEDARDDVEDLRQEIERLTAELGDPERSYGVIRIDQLEQEVSALREAQRWRDPAVEMPEPWVTVVMLVPASVDQVTVGYRAAPRKGDKAPIWMCFGIVGRLDLAVTGWMPLPAPAPEVTRG